MQRLRKGPLVDAAGTAELWLDGGHNPAAGAALAETLASLPDRPTYLICGMLSTKDVAGYLAPLAEHAKALYAVGIPGEAATLSPSDTAAAAEKVGLAACVSASVDAALAAVLAKEPHARVLICGSLYLAGAILRENA